MSEAVELWERPEAEEIYFLIGWRQWADAGSVSSGLPQYLIKLTEASQIGQIRGDGFYLFQIPGTHDLVRPVVKFVQGYPESLQTSRNELHYAEVGGKGILIFLGDEPHIDVERYTVSLLSIAQTFNVRRIVGFGGVYGELPYDKERLISSTYSLPNLKDELSSMSVNLSDYHGGASIGSFVCRRAGDLDLEYVAFYAFVPAYDFSNVAKVGNTVRIENDYMAWLGIMQRVNYMLKINLDLSDLELKSKNLVELFDSKIEELESIAPQIGIRDYLKRLAEEYREEPFTPLDDVWKEEIRRLFGELDSDESK
jgi:proteasome assembly chaperone (PAC2) family protein